MKFSFYRLSPLITLLVDYPAGPDLSVFFFCCLFGYGICIVEAPKFLFSTFFFFLILFCNFVDE